MTDRGFQITEELIMKYCTLSVPPGARIKSQMTNLEVRKTKKIANLRIHVERAINRIKSYRILKSVLLLTVLHSCDDIIRTCARLCNLKPLLFKNSTVTEWYLLLCNVIPCTLLKKCNLTRKLFFRFFIVSFLSPFFAVWFLKIFSQKKKKKAVLDLQCLKSLICFEILFFSKAEQRKKVKH